IAANSPTTQSAPAGSAVSSPPAVTVHDASGNPVAGVTVTFTPAAGSGSVTGGTQTTNASGIATVGSWTLSTTAGTNTLTAAASGLTGSPVTFTAEGTAGAAGRVAFTTAPSSAAQSGVPLAQQPVLQLEDANGNPVSQSGVVVTATLTPARAPACTPTATTTRTRNATFSGLTLTVTAVCANLTIGS